MDEADLVTIPRQLFDLMLEALEVVNVAPEVRSVCVLDWDDMRAVRRAVLRGQEMRATLSKTEDCSE